MYFYLSFNSVKVKTVIFTDTQILCVNPVFWRHIKELEATGLQCQNRQKLRAKKKEPNGKPYLPKEDHI